MNGEIDLTGVDTRAYARENLEAMKSASHACAEEIHRAENALSKAQENGWHEQETMILARLNPAKHQYKTSLMQAAYLVENAGKERSVSSEVRELIDGARYAVSASWIGVGDQKY